MRKLLTFAPVLLILLSTGAMAQGRAMAPKGPQKCPQTNMPVPKSCWVQWDAMGTLPLTHSLPYVPSLIVLNITHRVGYGDEGYRPYEQIVIRSVSDTQSYTTFVGTWGKEQPQCTFKLQLQAATLTLEENSCASRPAFEYTLIP